MTDNNTYYAYFAIQGDFVTSEVIEYLEVFPNESYNKGDLRPNGKTCYSDSRIQINIENDLGNWNSIEALDKFEEKFVLMNAKLTKINQNYDLEFHLQLVVKLYLSSKASIPSVGLSSKLTKFLASIDASFDVDIYNYEGNEERGQTDYEDER